MSSKKSLARNLPKAAIPALFTVEITGEFEFGLSKCAELLDW